MSSTHTHPSNTLTYRSLGIHTQYEHFVYMRTDCHICIAEGFDALTRIRVFHNDRSIVASLNVLSSDILKPGEISLSLSAAKALGVEGGETLRVSHLEDLASLSFLRSKIYGNKLSVEQMNEIVEDIVNENYSNVHLSAFITANAGGRMAIEEIISLTKAMIASGKRLQLDSTIVVDKHSVGGLPGNRITLIVVSIVAAFGLMMPKTSSRAITSPAGTADTMEVMSPVDLSLQRIREVVRKEGGCIAWGGEAGLSPADDILIRVEKALDIDSEGQLIASILSKKVAAGSSHVVIDIPVGETAKLRSKEDAHSLKENLETVAKAVGLKLKIIVSDGSQPVGRGIGPALEARDVLSVLRREPNAPQDLKEKALLFAGALIALSGAKNSEGGTRAARELLESGKAYEKFISICNAQGGFKEPQTALYRHEVRANEGGIVTRIDNRKLAQLAKLTGAPNARTAGVDFLSPIGTSVAGGQVLYVLHAESKGGLEYAMEYHDSQKTGIVSIQ